MIVLWCSGDDCDPPLYGGFDHFELLHHNAFHDALSLGLEPSWYHHAEGFLRETVDDGDNNYRYNVVGRYLDESDEP